MIIIFFKPSLKNKTAPCKPAGYAINKNRIIRGQLTTSLLSENLTEATDQPRNHDLRETKEESYLKVMQSYAKFLPG